MKPPRGMEVDSFPQCAKCTRFNEGETRLLLSCEAYPDGIPQDFVIGAAVCKDKVEGRNRRRRNR